MRKKKQRHSAIPHKAIAKGRKTPCAYWKKPRLIDTPNATIFMPVPLSWDCWWLRLCSSSLP
eukprot:scaffold25556_cov137-Amphora_coffeaeformis.AAC.1